MDQQTDHRVVVLKRYFVASEAHIDAGVLDAHGIRCTIEGEIINNTLPYMALAVPIALCVSESDAQAATEVLGLEPILEQVPPVAEQDAKEPRGRWGKLKRWFYMIGRLLVGA